jgi:hypothetical protein
MAAATAAAGLATAILGPAWPALSMPVGPDTAQDTVNQLEAQGYKVILNKIGTAALNRCTVTAVRPGVDVTRPGTSRVGGRDPAQVVLYTTVYVDVVC